MSTLAPSSKRSREQESNVEESTQSPSSSTNSPPTTKSLRLTRAERASLYCSLPPTCNPPHNDPTALADVSELESHYAKYHAHVCEERGCAAVFPNARLLELHQTECHDPISLLKKERGEKIFACHLESCPKKFLTPKRRRLHLIQAHGFPKEYFFAVTNKGVGGLLKRWGEGASMLRGTWKARDNQSDVNGMDVEDTDGDDSIDEEMLSTGTVKNNVVRSPSVRTQEATNGATKKTIHAQQSAQKSDPPITTAISKVELDDLAGSMDSLSLVPSNVRFGRGGRNSRMVRQSGVKKGKRSHNSENGAQHADAPDETISRMEHEDDTQLSDHEVSINIDGALEALKSEAPPNDSGRSVLHVADTDTKHSPTPGKRVRGGRGRGRGLGRGHGRGRT